MDKKLIMLSIVLTLSLKFVISQTTEIWGISKYGGDYNAGCIHKTDNNGENQELVYSFHQYHGVKPNGVLCEASNGILYGVTEMGGFHTSGVIFSFNPSDGSYSSVFDFYKPETGGAPIGGVIQADNGKLYGVTRHSTNNGLSVFYGVLYEFDLISEEYTIMHEFDELGGARPSAGLMQANNGNLYGATSSGGEFGTGCVFEYDISSGEYSKLLELDSGSTYGSLLQANNDKIYGLASGGEFKRGVLFEIDLTNDTCIIKYDFDGVNTGRVEVSESGLIQHSDGDLYGTTRSGGENSKGVLFKFNIESNTYTKLFDFTNNLGSTPILGITEDLDGNIIGTTTEGGAYNVGVLFEFNTETNTYSKIIDFKSDIDKGAPSSKLLLTESGALYGLSIDGGEIDKGVLYKYNCETNQISKEINFGWAEFGCMPTGGLVEFSDGNLYGMTSHGGNNNRGTIFSFDVNTNTLTKRIEFGVDDYLGYYPYGDLFRASNDKLYGFTSSGGVDYNRVLFEYDPSNNLYTKKLDIDYAKAWVSVGALVQASNDKIYGVIQGNDIYDGILFEYDIPTNNYTVKINFDDDMGKSPRGGLVEASNGKLYGTCSRGGLGLRGTLYEYDFINESLLKLHDFEYDDGHFPTGRLTEVDHVLYGLAQTGGVHDNGILFKYDFNNNSYEKLFDFDSINGSNPEGQLLLASNNNLYGRTKRGGENNQGVVFEYDFNSTLMAKSSFSWYNGYSDYDLTSLIEVDRINIGVSENVNNTIQCFPNPTTDFLFIENEWEENEKLSILDVAGCELINFSSQKRISGTFKIDLSTLNSGVYLLRIGNSIAKIVKE